MKVLMNANWVVSRNYDMGMFIMPVLLSLVVIIISHYKLLPIVLLWWGYVIIFDSPHLMMTYFRTYFDKVEREEKASILLKSWLAFLIGPFCVLLGFLMEVRTPIFILFAFLLCYGHWHIARQHYGFFTMYQKVNGEKSGTKNQSEFILFHLITMLPLPIFLLGNPSVQRHAGINQVPDFAPNLISFLSFVMFVCLIIYALKQVKEYSKKGRFNLPKNLLAASVFFILILLVYTPLLQTIEYFALVAVLTIFHNVQYGGIVWFFSKNKYHPSSSMEYGLAAKISQSILIFLLIAFIMGALYKYFFWYLLGWDFPLLSDVWLFEGMLSDNGSLVLKDLIYSVFIGVPLQHYYIEQKIWKLSKDKGARKSLKLSAR